MKNKKGFTLIELLAVIVILIIIIFIAIVAVRNASIKIQTKALKADVLAFVKEANNLASVTNNDGKSTPIEGLYDSDRLYEMGVKLDGKKPDNGYVFFYDDKVIKGCLSVNKYSVKIIDGEVQEAKDETCPNNENINLDMKIYSYSSSDEQKSLVLNEKGKYLLEVWGAQGGSATVSYNGGYGSYSKTYLTLNEAEQLDLYINVGGSGASNCNREVCNGGYNGGGSTGSGTNSNIYYGGGGGATSISTQSGLLSSLESNKDKIILVAGGGGGATKVSSTDGSDGASAGGYIGSSTEDKNITNLYYGTGGSQMAGGISSFSSSNAGQFGLGGSFVSAINNVAQGGAGAGYYGGGYAGGAGSGYIASTIVIPSSNRFVSLENSVMYCKDCQESINSSTRTKKTDLISENAYSNTIKSGSGFARITYIGE